MATADGRAVGRPRWPTKIRLPSGEPMVVSSTTLPGGALPSHPCQCVECDDAAEAVGHDEGPVGVLGRPVEGVAKALLNARALSGGENS